MATSTHNKYVSIPDWFSSSSSTPITSTEKPANITNVYYGGGGGGGTTGITEIPIDNKTIVWLDLVITVPIDNDKIIINTEGKITTSGTTGVWELRQLTDGTNYIYTTYPVVTQLGITMYAGTDGLDLGSIYDGLPIDNATIYWDLDENGNKILKAVGSSGGVADSVAWVNVTGKPDWLLDGKILYTEIEGIPDLSGFITKDYIDGKFVTFDLNETIDGIKTFTNGIKIGTSLINQSLNDVIYVDANLVVRGGITMYATGTVDIPSILDSLPVAGTDSKGIASFDSSYFSVTNGKVTLLADNVGLNESELAEYLNTNNYAKKSDIPSLNGYATQLWVESKGYALNSDLMLLTTKVDDFLEGSDTDTIINKWLELEAFLSGLSESDNLATILGTKADKTYVDETFVTIGGNTEQVITGAKNFTGGIKINGSPIYYDTEKKYWKFEGDLLVTGGVTMYGSDSSFTPSTIMDAINVDETTISKEGGVLKVIGGTGGGLDITALQNYLTQNSYLNVTEGDGRYLKLSGGTMGGNIVFQGGYLRFINSSGSFLGAYNVNDSGEPLCLKGSYWNIILHSGNYSKYALPLSGGEISGTGLMPLTINTSNSGIEILLKCKSNTKVHVGWSMSDGVFMQEGESEAYIGVQPNKTPYYFNGTRYTLWHEGNFTPSNYLPLSGGTLDGVLTLRAPNSSYDSWIEFSNKSNSVVHKLGVRRPESSYGLQYYNGSEYYKIWHEGNFTPSNYLPLSGGTITSASPVSVTLNANNEGQTALFLQSKGTNKTYVGWDINRGTCLYDFSSDSHFGILNGIPRFNSNTIWHSGNDGDGSGLEADTIGTYKKDSGEKTIIYGTRSDNSNIRRIYDNGWNLMCQNGSDNGVIATLNSNVASATKLQTTRTIWGQSFDGTGNVSGELVLGSSYITGFQGINILDAKSSWVILGEGTNAKSWTTYINGYNINFRCGSGGTSGLYIDSKDRVGIGTTSPAKKLHIYDSNISNDSILLLEKGNAYDSRLNLTNSVDSLSIIQQSTGNALISLKGNHSLIFETSNSARFTIDSLGNVGIGTASPSYKLDVSGEIRMSGAGIIGGGLYFTGIGSGTYNKGSIMCNNTYGYEIEAPRATDSATGTALPIFIGWRGGALGIKITSGGNLLANGGITMYSDQRKKTILNHVELSLKQIADAPLIEHYYNSDDKKTTHVGSIAQYWASMNNWFCKLDSEGYYTMEIQNAALASAISIARELDRYETKTDKAIKKLKKRICELEEEVKLLKAS